MRIIKKETSNSVMGNLKSLHQGDDISTESQRVLKEDREFVRFIRWSGHSRQKKKENMCNHPDIKIHGMECIKKQFMLLGDRVHDKTAGKFC